MDENHLLACARYVELNPVSAGMVAKPENYKWSSARAHLAGKDDALVRVEPLLSRIADWADFLEGGVEESERQLQHQHSNTGRPLGADDWLAKLEAKTGRRLKPRQPGRLKKERA